MKGIILSFSVVILLAPSSRTADERECKIAIASEGKTAESLVARKAARSPYYLFYGEGGELLEVVENPHKDVNRGAGTMAAEFLAQKEVTLVVAGMFGSNMTGALDAKTIRRFEFTGKVGEAIKKALDQEVSKPDFNLGSSSRIPHHEHLVR